MAFIGDQDGVLPLGGKAAILGDDGPLVWQQFHVTFAGVDHGFNGEGHTRFNNDTGARAAVVQHLRVFVEDFADTMPTVLAYH